MEVETEFTAERLRDYPGIRFETGGEAQETMKAMGDLVSFAIAALGIYRFADASFTSLTQPLMVILAISSLAASSSRLRCTGWQVSFSPPSASSAWPAWCERRPGAGESFKRPERDKRRDETMAIDLIASGHRQPSASGVFDDLYQWLVYYR